MVSKKPGTMNCPVASITVAPAGTATVARGPAAVMRSLVTTTTASGTGAPPLPSISVAPVMAVMRGAGVCARGTAAPAAINANESRARPAKWGRRLVLRTGAEAGMAGL